jgi:WD40 repeat protein
LSRLFISHSSRNDDWAIALKDWLVREGWSGEHDIFLDVDPERGIAAGQRWRRELENAATRCEAVLFIVSEDWLASKWCNDEYQLASGRNKNLFALLIDDIGRDRLPGGLAAQWQIVTLKGEPAERFVSVHPYTQHQSPVHIAEAGLKRLKRGLEKAGIGAETFELQPDATGPLGWRAPYRGLEALEPEDAAVFFGRNADIVRGVDALRGLAARNPPRLLVILGASGAGKSSFLRAGLWPRLNRDDRQWLPLRVIRAGRGGAIEGGEGLLAAMEEVHRRFGLRASRADLRERLATPGMFVALLRELRLVAARRALISEPPFPLPILCLDQGEEMFSAEAAPESERLLQLARHAIDCDEALLLVTIRSDAYGAMQEARMLAGVEQTPLSLGPVPHGEIAHVIRAPAEILRLKAGPAAPLFDAAVVERLQAEIENEDDALPLLAFVMQRLMREHAGAALIGVNELERTGGVAAALEAAAEAALADAGFAHDRAERRDALRRLFIPRLARIVRDSRAPRRRTAPQGDLPADLVPLARALTQRRLLVVKLAAGEAGTMEGAATLEVAHEALLRRWPTLADLLQEDREALLLLDGVLSASVDWSKADADRRLDYLAHRGSRLADALALTSRGPDWAREIAPAHAYLAACQAREVAERDEKETALRREQEQVARTRLLQRRSGRVLVVLAAVVVVFLGYSVWQYRVNAERQARLDRGTEQLAIQERLIDLAKANVLAALSRTQVLRGEFDSALRLASQSRHIELKHDSVAAPAAPAALGIAISRANWFLVLAGHKKRELTSAGYSPDGSRIVTGSTDRTARIWDAASGKEIAVLGHDQEVTSVAFSPDGSRILTTSGTTVRIWDAVNARQVAILPRQSHDLPWYSAGFSSDGSRIVAVSKMRTAIWDTVRAEETIALRGGTSAAISPDGSRVAVGDPSGGGLSVRDSTTGAPIVYLESPEEVNYIAFSPDGALLAIAVADKTARIFDAVTGKEIAVLEGHEKGVTSVAFSSDGLRLVTASADTTARIWDVQTHKMRAMLRGHQKDISFAAFSPDGSRVLTASSDGTARIWGRPSTKPIAILRGHENQVTSVAFSPPDGSRVVTTSRDGTARIWNSTTAEELFRLNHSGRAAYSPDGSRIAIDHKIFDATRGVELVSLPARSVDYDHFDSLASFSPDGSRIIKTSGMHALIWHTASGEMIKHLQALHVGHVTSVAFSPDGSRIVTAGSDGTVRIWGAEGAEDCALTSSCESMVVLRGHTYAATSAAFSADGSRIVTASDDSTARIWDAVSGKMLAVLEGHGGPVISAAFSPDGLRIVTAAWDGAARIWDVLSATEIATLRPADNWAAFSPDGSRIATASNDGIVRIWDADALLPNGLVDACKRLAGISKFTPEEMRIAGYPADMPAIKVCGR